MAQLTEGTKLGPYTIEKTLPQGRGGMARVFIAQVAAGAGAPKRQRVALKIAIPEGRGVDADQAKIYIEAIHNEVEILKRLKHPNIVRIFSIPWGTPKDPYVARASGMDGEPWFFAMEYLEGGSLKQLLERRGKLETGEALEIVSQVGLALDYAHSKNIAHLDVKPDNVLFRTMLTDDGDAQAVLVDWGISANIRKLGLDAGSMPFLPPERVRERRGDVTGETADRRPADVYALGVMLYRSLTGKMPFDGKDRDHLETAILNSYPTRPRDLNPKIPDQVQALILDAMEKDPDSRLTIHEFNDRIDDLKRGFVSMSSDGPLTDAAGTGSGRGRGSWIWLFLFLVLLLLGGGGFLAMNNGVLGALLPTATPTLVRTQTRTATSAIKQGQPTQKVATAAPSATRNLVATATLLPSETPTPKATSTPIPTSTPTRRPTLVVTRTPSITPEPTQPPITETPPPTAKEKPEKPGNDGQNNPPPEPTEKPQVQPTEKPTKEPKPPTPPP